MVKASAGGGGRGMRLVDKADELANAIKLARAEATAAFGNDELILEKAIIRPRHVKYRYSGTATVILCTSVNGTALSNAATRRWWKKRPVRL